MLYQLSYFRIFNFGEENETRTHTTQRSLPPQSSASTNSAISPLCSLSQNSFGLCPEQDSNLHVSQHSHLKRARLPFRHLGIYRLLPMSGKRGSNSRPQPWQGCALPTELFPRVFRLTGAKVALFFNPAKKIKLFLMIISKITAFAL